MDWMYIDSVKGGGGGGGWGYVVCGDNNWAPGLIKTLQIYVIVCECGWWLFCCCLGITRQTIRDVVLCHGIITGQSSDNPCLSVATPDFIL